MSFTSASTDHPTAAPSRWRDVYVAASARAISSFGTYLAVTALVLTLQPVSGYAVSALILASTVPVVLLAPVAGRLADRVDSRVLLVTVGGATAATAAALAFAGEIAVIVALMAVIGSGQAVLNPTLAALTPSMVRRDDLPRASAVNQTAYMIGMLTGPASAGILLGAHGAAVPLMINAVAQVAIVVAGLLVRTRRGGGPSPAAQPDHLAPGHGAVLRHDPLLRAMMVSLAAVVAAVGAMNVVEVFLVRDTLGASEAMYGFLEATWTAGVLAGTWLLARVARRARDDGSLVYGLLVTLGGICATLTVAATVGAATWLLPLWIAGGACNGGINVYANVLVAHRTPERSRGQVFATLGAAVHGAGMAGYAGGGMLVETLPVRPVVAGLGLAGLAVTGMLAAPVARTVRHEREGTRHAPGADTSGGR